MSRLTEWIQNKFVGYPCALPPHLKNRLHNDWPPIVNHIPRSWNARGARCPRDSGGFLSWPPRLLRGKGIARWETTGANSIIYIKSLENVEVTGDMIYGMSFDAVELNRGNPNYKKIIKVKFPQWRPAKVWDELVNDRYVQRIDFNDYHPSALQKYSRKGYMVLDPYYKAIWKWNNMKELDWELNDGTGEGPEDRVFFTRSGNRPDSLDGYYNADMIPIGFFGLHWE